MHASPVLRELATLVAALRTSAGDDDARRSALRALTRAARHGALVLRLDDAGATVDGQPLRGAAPTEVAELLALLRAAGVAELHVRKHAGARELAQLAGALARRATGHVAVLGDELTALRLWSVRAIAGGAAAAAEPPAAVRAIVSRAHDATDDASRESALRELAGWIAATLPGDAEAASDSAADEVALALAAVAAPGVDVEPAAREAARAVLGHALALPGAARAVAEAIARGIVPPDAPVVTLGGAPLAAPLVAALSRAGGFDERRRCADALLAIGTGFDALVHALAHDEWYVVRNAALVLGELRDDGAVRPLARLLTHADDRVRAAAAMALGQIATPASRHSLLGVLRDRCPEVRRVAARAAAEVARAGLPLSARVLLHALHDETDADAASELADALASLGSADGRDGLLQLAAGRLGNRLDDPARVAAIEAVTALARAGDAEAAAAVRTLSQDGEPHSRHAARNAMQRAYLREQPLARPVLAPPRSA